MGNFLGPRGNYVYTDDFDNEYLYTTDQDLAAAVGATAASESLPTLPSRFSPRVIYVEFEGNRRKQIIVPNIESDAWDDTSGTITVGEASGQTTGRRGEKQTFLRFDGDGGDDDNGENGGGED